MDNADYTPGDQFDAQTWWITRERQVFADMWREKDKKKKKKKKSSKDRHYAFTISGAGPSGSKKAEKDSNKTLQEFVRRQNDTVSDGTAEDSDEVPLSRTLASKSKGKARPALRRKTTQPQDDSDMHEDDLPRTMPSKGKRSISAPGTSTATGARPSKPIRETKRRRLSSPEGDKDTVSDETIRKHTNPSQPIIITEPATPPHRVTNRTHDDSPSSLFSAPSSPVRLTRPAALGSPSLSMHTSLGTTATGPKKLPPSRPTGSQPKAVRKPTWFLEPKIKRFDAPNLKPGSTLPTKANLGVVRTSNIAQPSTSGRSDTIQSPVELASPHTPSTLEGGAAFEQGWNVDGQRQGSVPQSAGVQTPPVQDTPRLPPASMAETEAFLNNVMPTEMSEPMMDGVEPNRPPSIPIHRPSVSDLLKKTSIPRKFKWSGELRINTEKDHKERLCNVTLSDVTDGSAARLRFSICFTPSVSFLLLEKLFSLGELQWLQPALTPVAEIAKLGPDTPADEKLLSPLFLHMSSRKLVSCSNIYIDDNQVAMLLVFPVSNLVLCKEYNVRQDLRKAGHFIAALLPWKVVGIKARAHRLFRDPCDGTHDTPHPGKMKSIVMAGQGYIRKDPSYHRDLSILGFPKWLHDEMSESRYCIWNKDGDGSPNHQGFETRALIHVLDERRATNKGLKADVDFVFVHVGAIKTLNQLPALMERRMKRLDIQFVTYGTHHTVPPTRWGIRQIYPAGGIVTFSPSAFAECPSTTYRLLDMLEQHPLWDCFVTPGVVALMARQNQGSDPVSEFEKGTLIHQDLLSRIGQGQLSLLCMEPPHYGPKEGPLLEWIRRHQETSMLEPRGILEDSLRSFNKHFSELPEEKWSFNVLTELLSILFSLQMQPCMMDQYRRFVVITGRQDKIAPDRGGFEWTNIDGFNFRDDFFSKEKMDDLRTWASVEQALFTSTVQSP